MLRFGMRLVWPMLLISWCCITLPLCCSMFQVGLAQDDVVAVAAVMDDDRATKASINTPSSSSSSANRKERLATESIHHAHPSRNISSNGTNQQKLVKSNSTINKEDSMNSKNTVKKEDFISSNNTTTQTTTTTTTTTNNEPPTMDYSSQTEPSWPPLRLWNDTNKEDEEGNDNDDDKTYLDIFGEVAKEVLTQQMIPLTDPECEWNWKYLRCEPYCHCGFIPMWGDYHLGRSCRRLDLTPHRGPLPNASESSLLSPPPALSPCEYDGDEPTPFYLAQQLIQERLQQVPRVAKSAANWGQEQLKELAQSPASVKAQQNVQKLVGVAHNKLNTWQSQVCADVPCLDEDETTSGTTPETSQGRSVRPLAWSQRFFCHNLPFSTKCDSNSSSSSSSSSSGDDTTQERKFPWPPPDGEIYFDANAEGKSSTKQSSTEQKEQPPSSSSFREWGKKA